MDDLHKKDKTKLIYTNGDKLSLLQSSFSDKAVKNINEYSNFKNHFPFKFTFMAYILLKFAFY